MSLNSSSNIGLVGLYQSKSRWSDIVDVRNILPNIFPDPRKPLYLAKMTLQEPPQAQELLERYIKAESTDERLKVLAKFYAEMEGIVFETSCLLRDLEVAKQMASKKRNAVYQLLGEVLEEHIEHKADGRPTKVKARLRELMVHPYNTRIIPHDADVSVGNFDQLCKDRGLRDPLLVVPVTPQGNSTKRAAEGEEQAVVKTLAEVHMKLFEYIQQKIMLLARSDAELRRAIEVNGIGWVMRAVTGYREVMLKDGRLVFTENDPFRKAFRELGIRLEGPKYFIIDGQMRALAMSRDFLQGLKDGTYSPDGDEVYVQIIYDADLVTVPYLSIILNTGLREVSEEELRRFFGGAGGAFSASLRTIADVIGSEIVKDATKKYHYSSITELTSPRLTVLGKDVAFRREPFEPSQPSEGESKEEEHEKRRWERREETAVKETARPPVSEVQRPAPTFSYAPTQPQPSAQMPISPFAQPSREEVLKAGAPPSVAEVLAEFLWFQKDSLKPRKDTLLQSSLGNEAKLTIDFSHVSPLMRGRIAKKLRSERLETTVVVVPFDDFVVKLNDVELLASGYLLFYKTNQGLLECPNPECRALVPLGPIRCLRCGQLIEGVFPYEFSFSPKSSK